MKTKNSKSSKVKSASSAKKVATKKTAKPVAPQKLTALDKVKAAVGPFFSLVKEYKAPLTANLCKTVSHVMSETGTAYSLCYRINGVDFTGPKVESAIPVLNKLATASKRSKLATDKGIPVKLFMGNVPKQGKPVSGLGCKGPTAFRLHKNGAISFVENADMPKFSYRVYAPASFVKSHFNYEKVKG